MERRVQFSLRNLGLDDDDDEDYDDEPTAPQPAYVRPPFGFEHQQPKPYGTPFAGFNSAANSPFAFFGLNKRISAENTMARHRETPHTGRVYTQNGPASSRQTAPQEDTNSPNPNSSLFQWNISTNALKKKLGTCGTTDKTRAPKGFIPPVRDLALICEDDEKASSDYATVGRYDENLDVFGVTNMNFLESWDLIGLDQSLIDNIKRAKYLHPRHVQRVAIPLVFDAMDLLVCTETGSGKTAAYLIPIIAMCMQDKSEHRFTSHYCTPYALIIVPTRELAHQIFENAFKFIQNTGVTVAKMYGEYALRSNCREIENGCDIIIATPGRLRQFFEGYFIDFKQLRFLVLDECDVLLGTSFVEDVDAVVTHENFAIKTCYQTLMFSATIGEYSIRRTHRYLREGESASIFTKKCTVNKLCVQEFQRVLSNDRLEKLKEFLAFKMAEVGNDPTKFPQILIFVNRQSSCDELTKNLQNLGYDALGIQGNHSQDNRLATFDSFRGNGVSIMVTTDLCARGIDIKGIDLVLNYELPYHIDTYIYRVGRVGRIRQGHTMSFVDPQVDNRIIPEILEALQIVKHPVSSVFDELVEEAKSAEFGASGFDNVRSFDNAESGAHDVDTYVLNAGNDF